MLGLLACLTPASSLKSCSELAGMLAQQPRTPPVLAHEVAAEAYICFCEPVKAFPSSQLPNPTVCLVQVSARGLRFQTPALSCFHVRPRPQFKAFLQAGKSPGCNAVLLLLDSCCAARWRSGSPCRPLTGFSCFRRPFRWWTTRFQSLTRLPSSAWLRKPGTLQCCPVVPKPADF